MTKQEESSLMRFFSSLPEVMNTPIPGLDIFDRQIPIPGSIGSFLNMEITLPALGGNSKNRKRNHSKGACAHEHDEVVGSFVREGMIQKGIKTPFAIAGKDFIIYENAWVMGEVRLGVRARVTGIVRSGAERYVTKIQVLREGESVEEDEAPLHTH